MRQLKFCIGEQRRLIAINELVIVGMGSSNLAIADGRIGKTHAPKAAQMRQASSFCRLSAGLLTTKRDLGSVGVDSRGAVEFVIVAMSDGMYVGVGSDHTEHEVEDADMTMGNQACPKPVGRSLWRLDEILMHWDKLVMRSWISRDGKRILFQEGRLDGLLQPLDLIRRYAGQNYLKPGTVLFGGSLPIREEIAGGEYFEIELDDPILGRRLRHEYTVRLAKYAS